MDGDAGELDRTIAEAACRSGELGIRTLALQADSSELATCVTAQAGTIDDLGSQTDVLVRDARNVSIAAEQLLGTTTGAHDLPAKPKRCRRACSYAFLMRYKTEVVYRRGPWRSFEAIEYATLEWVDWFIHRRLLEPIGNIPPAEAEEQYHAAANVIHMAA